jgi:hypothetical protein
MFAAAADERASIDRGVDQRARSDLARWWRLAEERSAVIESVCKSRLVADAGLRYARAGEPGVNRAQRRRRAKLRPAVQATAITRLRSQFALGALWTGFEDGAPTWFWLRPREDFYLNPTPSEAQPCVAAYRIRIAADRLTCTFADLEITRHCLLRLLQRCDPGIDI